MYTPKFNDPRVSKKIAQAIGYSCANLSATKQRPWSSKQIDKWFGHHRNALPQYLRAELLICTNNHYNKDAGKCKQYTLNAVGVAKLSNAIGIVKPVIPSSVDLNKIALDWATKEYKDEIESGEFEYKEKSNRLWNDILNIPNDIRKPLFANYGYVHEYDIKSAAPTLITQLAKTNGLTRPIKTVEAYLEQKDFYRAALADELGCSAKVAKKIITARFAGARFGMENSIAELLDYNQWQHDHLKSNKWFNDLTKDIKKMWDAIKAFEKKTKLSPTEKWQIYFTEEFKVMRCVRTYLTNEKIRFFNEHDGWRADGSIDLHKLKLNIKKSTGYNVDFDHEIYTKERT